MNELEQLLGLFVAAMVLAAVARRVGAPYPVFLALGGALLAFVPGAPSLTFHRFLMSDSRFPFDRRPPEPSANGA
jgi:hypothetical protein